MVVIFKIKMGVVYSTEKTNFNLPNISEKVSLRLYAGFKKLLKQECIRHIQHLIGIRLKEARSELVTSSALLTYRLPNVEGHFMYEAGTGRSWFSLFCSPSLYKMIVCHYEYFPSSGLNWFTHFSWKLEKWQSA